LIIFDFLNFVLLVSPRRGVLTAGRATALKTVGEDEAVTVPKPTQVEYFSEELSTEFAFLTQVLKFSTKSQT